MCSVSPTCISKHIKVAVWAVWFKFAPPVHSSSPYFSSMWRIIATLFFTAVAEFAPEQLDKMSSSLQTTADQLQDKVVSLSKEIMPLALKINNIPNLLLTASDEEKTEIQKQMKSTMTQVCGLVDSLSKVQADVQKDSADAKDTVAKIQAQATDMAGDLEKMNDGPKMQHYLLKFQKAIGTLDSAATSAATYTGMTTACDAEAKDGATSRLYLQMAPVSSVKFHLPSALLGALGAAVLGAALVIFRTKSARSPLALMEEGTLE